MDTFPDLQFEEIITEYRESITKPDFKGKQFLLCPIGIVGAGKTTVIKPLAEKLGLIRISGDEIRKLLKEKSFDYGKTEEIAFSVARGFVAEGYGIAIDSDCIRKKEQIEKISQEYNLQVIWIHINPPEEFIINKLRNFKHTWLFKDGEDAVKNYEARKPLHQNLDFNFTYTFDTSRSDISNQIDEAIEIIRKTIS